MVKFKSSKKEHELIAIVAERASKEFTNINKMSLMMDLDATHSNGTRLDFKKLLGFSTFDFFHDVVGIIKNINRKTGELENCFLPRCSDTRRQTRRTKNGRQS